VVAARLHDDGIGFAIVDNDATRLYVVVEVPRATPAASRRPATSPARSARRGPVAATLGRYEDRPSQRGDGALIAQLFTRGGVG
jgi:ATP-dependent DNA helicase DinG